MQLKYGKSYIDFTPPAGVHWTVLEKEANNGQQSNKELSIITESAERLLYDIKKVVKKGQKLLVIIPDHTRKCRLHIVLPVFMEMLEPLNLNVEFLVANGSHVVQPDAIIKEMVGNDIFGKFPVFQHDSKDSSRHYHFGKTDFGTEIILDKKVKDADLVLTVGGILFHYFAGYGGGPKMLLPGVAAYETIRINHSRTIDPVTGLFHSGCFEGNIETNPVYQDLKQVVKFVPNALSWQFALDVNGEIIKADFGPILETQQRILPFVKELYTLPVSQRADIVVASAGGFPSDVNLIQTHKSIHHAFQAVRQNGHILILAECPENVGSKTFMPYFEVGPSRAIGKKLSSDYQINGHTALSLKTKAEQANIYFLSNMDDVLVSKTGMIPVRTIAEAFKKMNLNGNNSGYILPYANLYIPQVQGE